MRARIATIAAMLSLAAAGCGKAASSPTSPTAPTQTAQSPAQTYATTTLSFSSDPADFIGAGQSKTLTLANSQFFANVNNNGQYLSITIRPATGTVPVWGFTVTSPNGTRIAPGSYDTTRSGLVSSSWGADFGGDGRGCGRSTGHVVVHAFDFIPENQALKNFRASFEQHCEGAAAALHVEIAILADPWR
jgi:hypothetical protein